MLLNWVLFLSVFFRGLRGFRGHNIRHHQIEQYWVPVEGFPSPGLHAIPPLRLTGVSADHTRLR